MRIALIGAGAMGRVVLSDLLAARDLERVVVADARDGAAEAAAQGDPRVVPCRLDAVDVGAVRRVIRSCGAVINAAQYHTNLPVLRAAIAEGVHYTDLGGLFHTTRAQLALDAEARSAGITAILGMGGAPGLTNLLAAYIIQQTAFETIEEIQIFLGAIDRTPATTPLPVPYSIRTILDECTLPPIVFTSGAFKAVQPFDGLRAVSMPEPVGKVHAHYTLHSEVATLPLTYAAYGVQEVSFRIAFPAEFARKLRLLVDLGFGNTEPIPVPGGSVAPREVLVALLNAQPGAVGAIEDCDVLRAEVRGAVGASTMAASMDLVIPSDAGLSGGSFDTGVPPSIAAQWLAAGKIVQCGVLAPEACLDPAAVFDELTRRRPIGGWPCVPRVLLDEPRGTPLSSSAEGR